MPPVAAASSPLPTGVRVPAGELFRVFLRLGLTAFGGPAMVAYLREVAVQKRGWLRPQEFQDGVALCQSIPGATVMQLAAYIGLRVHGPLGALAAFVAFGLPAALLMLLLSAVYARTRDVRAALAIFAGLQVVVVALVANAAWDFGHKTIKGWADAVLALAAGAFIFLGGHPIIAVCAAALAGLLAYRQARPPAAAPPVGPDAGTWARLRPALALLALFALGLAGLSLVDRRLFDLAALMAKVDLFALGGGFASVPLMLHEVVTARGWLDGRAFLDGIALGQVTPGPIVITATFVGYLLAGPVGALVGTVAIFSPSFIILLAVAPSFDRLRANPVFQRVLRGSLAAFIGLLAAVAVKFTLALPWTWPAVLIGLAALTALRLKVDVLWVVLAGAGVAAVIL